MDKQPDISAELKEISLFLSEINAATPYHVPAGYFDTLPGIIMGQLDNQFVLPVAQLPAYEVPAGYFDTLPGTILATIRQQENQYSEAETELQEIAPLLCTISKTNPYTVPAGYFDGLAFTPGAGEKKPAKLINFAFAKKWTQYAAAAVMAGILVTGAFLYTGDNSAGNNEYNRMDVSAELNKVSETDLFKYLDNPESSSTGVVADVKNTITTVSDEELDQYLSENQDVDMIIPVSN